MLYKFTLTVQAREGLIDNCNFYVDSAQIGKEMFFDEFCTIGDFSKILKGNTLYSIGCHSYSRVAFDIKDKVGNYCSIAPSVRFFRGYQHPYTAFSTSDLLYEKDSRGGAIDTENLRKQVVLSNRRKFRMGNDVWIGDDVMCSPFITLGTGCICAARANVTKDVPPYAIVGGNPARILKYRFEDKIIEQLLETRWTEYDIAPMKISGDIPVENFIEEFYNYRDKGLIKPVAYKKLKSVLEKLNIEYTQV